MLKVIRDISFRYDVHFTYDREIVEDVVVDGYNPDDYHNVDDALAKVLSNTKLKYVMLEMKYVIIYRDDAAGMESLQKMVKVLQTIIDEKKEANSSLSLQYLTKDVDLKNIHLERHRMVLNIKGQVKDAAGQPLIGVNVLVKDSNQGTATDFDGNFELNDVNENAILIFSYIGYQSQEVMLNGRSNISVTLNEDSQTLDQVVVVGYGTQSKRNVTGAIKRIDMEAIENLPNTNIAQALRGRVAGLQFTDNSRPGQSGSILIRGRRSINANNSPLIVLDGFIFGGSIDNINPNNISSLEILKDASATAIYGSRAANGVILITSKEGSSDKPTISINAYSGIQEWANSIDMLNSEEYIQMKLDWANQIGIDADLDNLHKVLVPSELKNRNNGKTIENPWEAISQNSSIQSYDVNVGGQSNNVDYFFSGSFVNEKGLVYNDNMKRIAFRMNLNTKITSWLNVGLTSLYSMRDLSGVSGSVNGAYRLSPYGNLYLEDDPSNLNPYPMVEDQLGFNPIFNANLFEDEDKTSNLFSTFHAKIIIKKIEGLSYRFNYSPNISSDKYYFLSPIYDKNNVFRQGETRKDNSERFSDVLENIIYYSKDLNEHNFIDLTLLYSRSVNKFNTTRAAGQNLSSDENGWNNLGLTSIQQISSSAYQINQNSKMFRLNYRFKEKYLFTFTVRQDGASVFGSNSKYGTFPSGAISWIVSEEEYLKNIKTINFLKLRLSHGKTGNQAISPYQSLERFSNTNYVFGDQGSTIIGFYPSGMRNDELGWESTVSTNIGVDFNLFNNKLNGSIDLYNSLTDGLLISRSLPSMTGFASVLTNLGQTRNRGVELNIEHDNLTAGVFSWSSGLNLTYNKNSIEHLYYSDINGDGIEDDDIGNEWFIGQPISVNFDYVFDGIYQVGDDLPNGYKPGFVRVKDIDNDGEITPDDRQVLSQKDPKYLIGLNNNFRIGKFDLSVFINSMLGWEETYKPLDPSNKGGNYTDRATGMINAGYWTMANQSKTRPSLIYTNPLNHGFYISRNFVRLQDVSLSYKFSSDLLNKFNFNSCKVYLSAKNLLTITKWPGTDPESGGVNTDDYPTARIISLGLSLSL
ncbi:TonB-dependent receptor [Membranihabitans marinus]